MTANTAGPYVGTGDLPPKHLHTRAIYAGFPELTAGSYRQLAGLPRQ